MQSQSILEGSIASTDDEICDQVLDTRPYYVRGLGYGITAPSSRVGIHSACEVRLTEVQRQTVEDRQQATVDRQQTEQRAQELAARIDEYQRLQI